MAEELENNGKENVKNGKKGKKHIALKITQTCGFVLLCAIFAILTVNSLLCVFMDHYYPTYGKYRLFAIVSDSMEPEIPTGDMIVGRVPENEDEIQIGTVITYELKQGNSIVLITHRVIDINVNSETGIKSYTTRGDNAPSADAVRPTYNDIVGIYTGNKCGFFGYFFGFLQAPAGAITLIIILLIIVLTAIIIHFINLVNVWRNIALNALKKSGSILNETNIEELGTIADVIGIVSKDPESKADIKRKDEKLNWFMQMSALPKRPYPNDLEEYLKEMGDSLKPVPVPKLKYADEVENSVSDGEQLTIEDIDEQAVAVNDALPYGEESDEDGEQLITVEQVLGESDGELESEEDEGENDGEASTIALIAPFGEEPEEEVRSVDKLTGMAIIVRYKRSFTAKLIQSSDQTKAYYSVLKNELLSYKKVSNRISWDHENFNRGRSNIVRFTIRGKSLCMYFALNPEEYAGTKYKVVRAESKKYENIPCMYRINNDRRAKYAIDLIAAVAEKFGLEKGEQQSVNYYMDYEPNQPLIERGLIKELISEEDYAEFMRRYSREEVDKNRREFVSASEVNSVISDDIAIALVEDKRMVKTKASSGKKGIINIDVLSSNFEKDETVNLECLKQKGLVANNVKAIKVLARGTLSKPLNVEADDFSIEAVKMIVLTGGKVTKV